MQPFIEVENLSKHYGGHWVIRGLNLTIDHGEVVVFQGGSGVGKSTFLRCLTHLESFQTGRIRIGNVDLQSDMDELQRRETVGAVRRQLGFVFQFFNLFPHLSVLENLMIGPVKVLGRSKDVAREDAINLLRRVKLEHKVDARPGALSGGQQQRVAIARTLMMRPKGILFDEPTSNLDPAMKSEIVEVMEDFAKDGLTMLIVTHEPAVVERMATTVIEFGVGCKIESRKTLPPLPFTRS